MPPPSIPERIRWTVELLEVRPGDHLLEIGCGLGHAVALVAERLKRGTITGIDRSALQISRATVRNAAHIDAGEARIVQAELESLDPSRRFDGVFAVNVNAFWTTPKTIALLPPLLKPTGSVHLVYEPPGEARLKGLRRSLPKLVEAHGFEIQDVQTSAFSRGFGLCVSGRPR